jgi:site-specific DNA recombinase
VDRLLRDPIAKGLRRANYTQSLGDNKHWKLKPESEWVFTKAEPIVPGDLWNRVNAILETQRENHRPPAKKPVQLFAGLTYCACGHKMYVPSWGPKYVCSKCRNKVPIADLDTVFAEQLKQFVLSPTEIADYLHQADEAIKDRAERLDVLDRERQAVRREMEKILRAYMDGELPVEGFGREYRPREERLKQLEDELPRLQGELDFLKIQYVSSDEVLAEARDLASRWATLTAEEKRQIVEQVVDRITVGKDEVAIDLAYLPTSSEITAKRRHNLRGSSPRRA